MFSESESSVSSESGVLNTTLDPSAHSTTPDANSDQHICEEADVTELLDTLDASDNMAKVVEARLDGILGNLDAFLADLEKDVPLPAQSNHPVEHNADRSGPERKG